MEKDFDNWNSKKKVIHRDGESKLYHQRELWWCLLGVNVGFEQDGDNSHHERPVLILKGLSRQTCLIVPLTTSTNKHPLRIPIGLVEGKEATVLMSQIKTIDTRRLVNKIGYLDPTVFELIRKAAKELL